MDIYKCPKKKIRPTNSRKTNSLFHILQKLCKIRKRINKRTHINIGFFMYKRKQPRNDKHSTKNSHRRFHKTS
jgi:hypothetical protein